MCFDGKRMAIQKEESAISARIPQTLKDLMKKFVSMDAHINESDFIRDAIREKIMKDAPELYRQLFMERFCSQCTHWQDRCLKGYTPHQNGHTPACREFFEGKSHE